MKKILTVLIATTALSACQQGGLNTGANTGGYGYGYGQNQNTYNNAGIGALLGAGAGALLNKDNREKGALIGAGVGALAGGAYGQYMDRQEAAMRQATQGTGIGITRAGNDLMLNMPSSITFGSDSSDIQSNFQESLNQVVGVLNSYPETIIEVNGHTDSQGSDSYNYNLSQNRANAVKNHLMSNGVSQRIITNGYGETQPIASNDTEFGRSQNRRVELKVSPIVK